MHCKNKLVVLTAKWLSCLHGLLQHQRLIVCFSCFFLFSNEEKRRKRQENYLSGCSLQLVSDTKISHTTTVITLWLEQSIRFYSMHDLLQVYHNLEWKTKLLDHAWK